MSLWWPGLIQRTILVVFSYIEHSLIWTHNEHTMIQTRFLMFIDLWLILNSHYFAQLLTPEWGINTWSYMTRSMRYLSFTVGDNLSNYSMKLYVNPFVMHQCNTRSALVHHADLSRAYPSCRSGMMHRCSLGESFTKATFMHHNDKGYSTFRKYVILYTTLHRVYYQWFVVGLPAD